MTVAARQIDPDAWSQSRYLAWLEGQPEALDVGKLGVIGIIGGGLGLLLSVTWWYIVFQGMATGAHDQQYLATCFPAFYGSGPDFCNTGYTPALTYASTALVIAGVVVLLSKKKSKSATE